jgi:hypothetical protein
MQRITFFGKTDKRCFRTNNENDLFFQHIWDKNRVFGVLSKSEGVPSWRPLVNNSKMLINDEVSIELKSYDTEK